jgi:uncharacterized protein YcbX
MHNRIRMVSALFVYPVKSLGGISLPVSEVERRGLKHDRRWMIVDEEGLFMTQRSDTRLALFRTAIDSCCLRVTAPSGETFAAPLVPTGSTREVRVWKDTCKAIQVSEDIDRWLTGILGKECSLVYMPDESIRQTNPQYTAPGDIVGFADGYQILIIGESSLEDLNSRLDVPLPMNRFRPNVVVKGWEPHQEDEWSELQIGNLKLRAAKKCGRCSVTATDQQTGEVGVEPLRTLATYRLNDQSIQFGAYFVPEQQGSIAVGDSFQGSAEY